jgi:uncharacterized membrane protein YphA (DoxX/SURF4 family)/peroxiredoxin
VELALLVARLFLSAVFLLAGVAKFADPKRAIQTLKDFGMPAAIAPVLSLLLLVGEIAVAAVLIPPALAWYGACGALALLGIFVIGVAITLARGRNPDCNCFGRLHSSPVSWKTLARNGILGALAGWLVFRGPLRDGPSPWAHFAKASDDERRLFIFAGCVMCFLFFRALRPRPAEKPKEEEASGWGGFLDWDSEESESPVSESNDPAPVAERSPVPQSPVQRKAAPAPQAPKIQPRSAAVRRLLEAGTGLPAGTPAPEFSLPALTGQGCSLHSLREQGKTICLVFASPHCESCRALLPYIARWTREYGHAFNIIVVSRGAATEEVAKRNGLDLSRVLLQREFELSDAYGVTATPAAVLVGADGLIQSQLAVGRDAIKQLFTSSATKAPANSPTDALRTPY